MGVRAFVRPVSHIKVLVASPLGFLWKFAFLAEHEHNPEMMMTN